MDPFAINFSFFPLFSFVQISINTFAYPLPCSPPTTNTTEHKNQQRVSVMPSPNNYKLLSFFLSIYLSHCIYLRQTRLSLIIQEASLLPNISHIQRKITLHDYLILLVLVHAGVSQ